MDKKGVIFTLASIFLVLVILAAFVIQANNKSKTDMQTSNIRIKTTNSFMDSLINNYLPDALEMTLEETGTSNPDESFLNLKIDDIRSFALKTGINFIYELDGTINVVLPQPPPEPQTIDASFDITFTILNKDVLYQDITKTITITDYPV